MYLRRRTRSWGYGNFSFSRQMSGFVPLVPMTRREREGEEMKHIRRRIA